MMDYVSVVWILGIMFWVLAALAIVCFIAYTYIQCMYYHWNKTEREEDRLKNFVLDTIACEESMKHVDIDDDSGNIDDDGSAD